MVFALLCMFPLFSFSQEVFTYQNPIKNGIDGGIRDAQIFMDGGKYYLIGTSHPFWPREGKNPGVKIYSSEDVLNWTFEKLLIDRSTLDTCIWYLDRFWAPEIQKIRGKYYLTFNCQNESTTTCRVKGQRGGVAVSDNILGPYTVLTHDEPLVNGNDLTLYEDRDGKVYAFWNGSKVMYAAEVDIDRMKLVEGSQHVIFRTSSGDWDKIGIEGPYCIFHEGIYYLFYSSWSRGYEIGYATASHPIGPWTKYEGNPVYGAQNPNACEKNGLKYTNTGDGFYRAVGHNEVWTGPDGRFWISCHGIPREDPIPFLVIEPIDIVDGVIQIEGPTHHKVSVPLGKVRDDNLNQRKLLKP